MSDWRTFRVVFAFLALCAPAVGCATGVGSDRETLDEVLQRLDESSRQRVTDAQRIDARQRRLAVLEALASYGPGDVAIAPAAMPAATVATAALPAPPPNLPVVRVAPVSSPPVVEAAQAPDTRAAGAVVELDPVEQTGTELAEGEMYEGVGFGNDPGGGYLQMGGTRSGTTVRIQGTPPQPASSTPSTLGTTNP